MKKKKKTNKGNFDGRFNAFKVRLIKSKDIIFDISKIKHNYSPNEISTIKKLISHPLLHKSIFGKAKPEKITEIKDSPILYAADLDQEVYWSIMTLSFYKEELIEFIKLKNKYSTLCLNGEFIQADELLESSLKSFGYSIWYIENKIAILGFKDGIEAEKKYSSAIIHNEEINDFIRFFAQTYSQRGEKNVSVHRYDIDFYDFEEKGVKAEANEHIMNYLRYKVYKVKQPIDIEGLGRLIWLESNSTIIDRFITLNYVNNCLRVVFNNEKEILIKYIDDFFNELNGSVINDVNFESSRNRYISTYNNFILNDLDTCFRICKEELLKEDCNWDFFELYIKSSNDSNFEDVKDSLNEFKYNVLNSLRICFLKENAIDASSEFLNKISMIFSSLDWSYQVKEFLIKHSSDYFFDKNISLEFFQSFKKENFDLFYNNKTQDSSINVDCDKINELYSGITTQKIKLDEDIHRDFYFGLKGIFNYLELNYSDSLNKFKNISDDNLNCSSLKFKGIINNLLRLNELHKALDYAVDIYFIKNSIYPLIPFKIIIETIKNNSDNSLKGNISYGIILELQYKSVVNTTLDDLKEAYEDFINYHNLNLPSEIINLKEKFDKNRIIYFLKNICVPEVMEIDVVNFISSESINKERINICRILSELDENNTEKYSEEINQITQKTLINSSIQNIEMSKIYVDLEGLVKLAKREYMDSYKRYISLLSLEKEVGFTDDSNYLTLFEDESEGITFQTPTNTKDNLFLSIFFQIRNDFVFNNLYGLDVALSVDIRHGILVGKLRSKFDEAKLITKKDENNKYIDNEYWLDRLDFLENNELNKLTENLNKFSQNIDNYLNWVNDEVIQIKVENNNSNGYFDFQVQINEDLQEFQNSITPETNFYEFLQKVYDRLWNMTDVNLEKIREFLKHEFKEELYGYFTDLLNFLEPLNNNNNRLEELISSIIDLRTIITTELNQVSTWFIRSKTSIVPDFKIDFLFELAEDMIQNHFPNAIFNIEKQIKDNDITIKGNYLKPLSNVIFILYHNILKHSELSKNSADLKCNVINDDSIEISLTNKTSTINEYKNINQQIGNIINALDTNIGNKKNRMQGGTGLYKLNKIFNVDLLTNYNIKVEFVDKKNFNVNLKFDLKKLKA